MWRGYRKALLFFALFAVSAVGAFYFFFISDRFVIIEVNISGLKAVRETEVRGLVEETFMQKRLRFLESRNYFLFSSNTLQARLIAAFPRIRSATVQKVQYNIVDIMVEERNAIGVWCRTSDCFYFDADGVIFVQAPKSFGSLMINVQDERYSILTGTVLGDIAQRSLDEIDLGDIVLTTEQVAFAQEAQGLVSRNFPFSIRTFLITKDAEYEILTSEGWRVLLDKNEEAEYQLSNLKYVLDEEIETRRRELEYVDLRLGNKVYYRYQGAAIIDGL